jgi:3-oxoacyl-[acyl-carrier-protein] synthase III
MNIVWIGFGSYLPERVVTNDEIERSCADYSVAQRGSSLDAWARRKHGGILRHRAAPQEATSDMAIQAARRALADARLNIDAIELIVMSTISGDQRLPQAAGIVQAQLGSQAKYIQLNSGCSGFIDSMLVASSMLATGDLATALVINADKLSDLLSPAEFLPHTVFGDGAAAVVLRRDDNLEGYGLGSCVTGSDGELGEYVWIRGGGSKLPICAEGLAQGLQHLKLQFREIGPWATERMMSAARESIARAGLGLSDIRWVVPHQASSKLITDMARELALPESMFVVTFPTTGNVSSASIPIALGASNERGLFCDGDWLVLPAAGAGMAWGSLTYRWYDYRARHIHGH